MKHFPPLIHPLPDSPILTSTIIHISSNTLSTINFYLDTNTFEDIFGFNHDHDHLTIDTSLLIKNKYNQVISEFITDLISILWSQFLCSSELPIIFLLLRNQIQWPLNLRPFDSIKWVLWEISVNPVLTLSILVLKVSRGNKTMSCRSLQILMGVKW